MKSATGSKVGTLRFIGETDFATGVWCGVEFEDATGKNDGTVGGRRYFMCEDGHGLFVPESKVERSPMQRHLSRQNTQESLISKLSLTSNTASKLRMNANTSVKRDFAILHIPSFFLCFSYRFDFSLGVILSSLHKKLTHDFSHISSVYHLSPSHRLQRKQVRDLRSRFKYAYQLFFEIVFFSARLPTLCS